MNGKQAKSIRRAVRGIIGEDVRHVWRELCGLTLRMRLRLAWMLIRGDKGGAA